MSKENVNTEEVSFADLGLSDSLLSAVSEKGYTVPTPIQRKAIPSVLMGRDVLGCAQTGTGKTAGFTLPMIDILASGRARARMPRALILSPTRELATQIAENFEGYSKNSNLSHALLIGGESFIDQGKILAKGVDVLIATPGRLMDMFDRGNILLSDVKILVIDEADRMLDMGFIPDVERIVKMLPVTRQTLFFTATMSKEIRKLADAFLSDPKEISVAAPSSTAVTVAQYLVKTHPKKKRAVLRQLLTQEDVRNAFVFCNRKRDIGVLVSSLKRHSYSAVAMHGDLSQSERTDALEAFKAKEVKLLVCSDVAARGIDVTGLSHVFNFDVPVNAEDYVHRIGRTGRAGLDGRTFMLVTDNEEKQLAAIVKLTGKEIPEIQVEFQDERPAGKKTSRRKSDDQSIEAKAPRKGRRNYSLDEDTSECMPELNDKEFLALKAEAFVQKEDSDDVKAARAAFEVHVPAFMIGLTADAVDTSD